VSVDKKFLLRRSTGDLAVAAEAELQDWLKTGQCRAADFLYEFAARKWTRAGDHPALAPLFADKPVGVPDRRVIYFLAPGGTGSAPLGPFSTKEILARAQALEICASTWVFVEGDKEWRQVRNVKILNDMMPALPAGHPAMPTESEAPPAEPLAPPPFSLVPAPGASASSLSLDSGSVSLPPLEPEPEQPSMPSIKLDLSSAMALGETPPPIPPPPAAVPPPIFAPAPASVLAEAPPPFSAEHDEPLIEREESTLAIDVMGLNLHSDNFAPPPSAAPVAPSAPPPKPSKSLPSAPPKVPPMSTSAGDFSIDLGSGSTAPPAAATPATPPKRPGAPPIAPPSAAAGAFTASKDDHFDGIVAEIPMDPIWLVKQAIGDAVSGPFRFLEVIKFLEEGKLNKNDKIARTGNKAFTKIGQQYEFNVKFSLENVIENGQEVQKILIRRRHPRVPYITGVQVVSKHGLQAGQCINISAGGILMEVPKAEFNLGEIIEVKILPGLIKKSISSKSLIIGKIPKIPPGYALKFEDLKPEDKEAIEHYVQETLKREMQNKK
jgi:hypothetical protein